MGSMPPGGAERALYSAGPRGWQCPLSGAL